MPCARHVGTVTPGPRVIDELSRNTLLVVARHHDPMRRAVDAGLIVGFLAVDFLFFDDVFKAGEVTTVPQYMTGVLSVLVFAVCSQSLLTQRR